MNTEKYFSIIVKGSLSTEAEEGNLDKNSGQPDGPTTKIRLQVGGTAIPNHSKVWAKRVLDPKTQKPTGKLEFMKWGEKGGELVPIRYLEGISSLDRNYQNNELKVAQTDEEKNESSYINLDIGINDFNPAITDPMLIEMLKNHTYCEDSICRNPGSKEIHYSIYDAKKLNASKIDAMRSDKRASDIILSAEEDSQRLAILATLFELDVRAQDEIIFNELLEILESDKKRVIAVVDIHKAKFDTVLSKLEDAGDLEYTENDVVLTIDHDRVPLIKDIETKNKKVYLVEHILDPDIYEVYQKVLEVDKKLVEQLN